MTRSEMLNRLRSHSAEWDIIIVGSGATVGGAIDAASRGFDTLLLEPSDFSKGTSCRSTRLAHGGIRCSSRKMCLWSGSSERTGHSASECSAPGK